MTDHTPTPWTFRDAVGAGLEISGPVYQVTGVELPRGMPDAPIKTFDLAGPATVLIAAERWVQFEPAGWHEMQAANAAFIIKAVNNHDALVAALKFYVDPANWKLNGACDPNSGNFSGLKMAEDALAEAQS